MLTLNDGRSELWQWDTGRKLTVDADCSQVHFSNKVFGRSIDVDVVDGTAAIPDVLLQVDNELIAWAFVGTHENGYTKISKVFKVNKRNKPADYVFTPPEQTTLGQIMKRLDRIEESQDPDAIKNAVDEYLANNPIQIDEKDPTVPDWAKQTTKPKYTATDVGAVAKVNGVKPDANGNVEITIPGSGGNVDYADVENKPKINGVELTGDKSLEDLGIGQPTEEQIGSAVSAYLDEHPEATTTVQNGSITEEKLSGSVIKRIDGNAVFSGKTASFYGDSLTEKNGHYTKGYHSWVKDLLGLASYTNYGVSGYKVSDVYNKVNSVADTADIIFVMCGVNDQTFSVPLGAMGDTTSGTTYGALNMMCALLKQKYPTKLVVFITPHYQTKYPHNSGVTSYEVSKAVREVCEKYAIPVFDNFVLSGIYNTNLSTFTTDNCHWNDIAHEMVGKNLAQFMVNTFRYIHGDTSSEGTHTHSYTETVTTAATCISAGVKTFTCKCGDSYTEEIPATGHNFVDNICSVCGMAFAIKPINNSASNVTYADGVLNLTLKSTFGGVVFEDASEVTFDTSELLEAPWFGARDGNVYHTHSRTKEGNADSFNWSDTLQPTKMTSGAIVLPFITTAKVEGDVVNFYNGETGELLASHPGDAVVLITSSNRTKTLNITYN